MFLTLVFEVSWPCSTLTMLLLARQCSWQLRTEAWILLCPYLLQLLGLLLWRLGLPGGQGMFGGGAMEAWKDSL